MKKLIIGLIFLLGLMILLFSYADAKTPSISTWVKADKIVQKLDQKTIDLVNKVVSQYKKDNKRDWKCTIDWEKISITAIVFGKLANESAYGTKWAAKKYNNRWNIKYAASKPLPKQSPKKTLKLDWWQYFIYSKPDDWVYDLVARIHSRWDNKCNISFASTYMYLKWPNAPKTAKNIKDTNIYMQNMYKTAMYFEKYKELYIVTWKEVDKIAKQINLPSKTTKTKWKK